MQDEKSHRSGDIQTASADILFLENQTHCITKIQPIFRAYIWPKTITDRQYFIPPDFTDTDNRYFKLIWHPHPCSLPNQYKIILLSTLGDDCRQLIYAYLPRSLYHIYKTFTPVIFQME